MNNLITYIKPFVEPFLSPIYIYTTLLGVLIGAFITYKVTTKRDRMIIANDAYKNLYSSFFITLATSKINIEIKKKELGKINLKKLNKENKRIKKIGLIGQQILDISDDFHKNVTKYGQLNFSSIVISRYFAVQQIKEQIRLIEASHLGTAEETQYRQGRLARLHYQLACAKILFVQAILEDMLKIAKTIRINDKETKETIKFFLKICRAAKEKEISKLYGIEESKNVKAFDEKDTIAG